MAVKWPIKASLYRIVSVYIVSEIYRVSYRVVPDADISYRYRIGRKFSYRPKSSVKVNYNTSL